MLGLTFTVYICTRPLFVTHTLCCFASFAHSSYLASPQRFCFSASMCDLTTKRPIWTTSDTECSIRFSYLATKWHVRTTSDIECSIRFSYLATKKHVETTSNTECSVRFCYLAIKRYVWTNPITECSIWCCYLATKDMFGQCQTLIVQFDFVNLLPKLFGQLKTLNVQSDFVTVFTIL